MANLIKKVTHFYDTYTPLQNRKESGLSKVKQVINTNNVRTLPTRTAVAPNLKGLKK